MENSGRKQIIRNIPIYIEGRDEPIINSDLSESINIQHNIQNNVENKVENENTASTSHLHKNNSNPSCSPGPDESDGYHKSEETPDSSIIKIQQIQSSVLELMSKVESFNGENKKEYAYLDEMLTQNLLKLDNIDVEGKENIKNARKEAIKCINSLITILDSKNEEFAKKNPKNIEGLEN